MAPSLGPKPSGLAPARSRPPRSGGASPSPSRSRTPSGCAAAVRETTSASPRSTRSSRPCRAAATSRWSTAKLTRAPRGLRRVRTGYAYQPPALGTYRTHRAACPQGPTYCTYGVRVPATAVPYVPRTVAPQAATMVPRLECSSRPIAARRGSRTATGSGTRPSPACTLSTRRAITCWLGPRRASRVRVRVRVRARVRVRVGVRVRVRVRVA